MSVSCYDDECSHADSRAAPFVLLRLGSALCPLWMMPNMIQDSGLRNGCWNGNTLSQRPLGETTGASFPDIIRAVLPYVQARRHNTNAPSAVPRNIFKTGGTMLMHFAFEVLPLFCSKIGTQFSCISWRPAVLFQDIGKQAGEAVEGTLVFVF